MNNDATGQVVGGVIVADNDAVVRGVLRSILVSADQDVFVAACGEEAVALAARVQARLVLLDLDMPRLNGLLACMRLRALPGYDRTPIAILTAHDGKDARLAAARAGATLFLAKPFQPAALLGTLTPYLDLNAVTREALTRGARRAREIAASDPERTRWRLRGKPDERTPVELTGVLDRGKRILGVYRL